MDATTSELMTIHDLAARWDVSAAKAKRHVRRQRVPFIQIDTDSDMRINWTTVRFRAEDVKKWEQDAVKVFDDPEPAKAPATTVGARHKHTRIR